MGAIGVEISHPTLACSRLNISENNSPLPRNRTYVSYRHFNNISETNVVGFRNALEIDQLLIGVEKSFHDGLFSLEVRLPISRQLTSDLAVIIDEANPSRNTVPLTDRDVDLGNLSVVAKVILLQRKRFILTGGLGVLIPTADDVNVTGDVDGNIVVIKPDVLFAFTQLDFNVFVANQTVNLTPFLSWLWMSEDRRFFHQGFLQLDVATNSSDQSGSVNGTVFPFTISPLTPLTPIAVDVQESAKAHQQTLLRMNFGFGYWLRQRPNARYLKGVAALAEVHYTTTLQNAKTFDVDLFAFDFNGEMLPVTFNTGNIANRNDIVDLSFGLSGILGRCRITHGFVFPLTGGDNKPFDFEYNLQVQREF